MSEKKAAKMGRPRGSDYTQVSLWIKKEYNTQLISESVQVIGKENRSFMMNRILFERYGVVDELE